MPCNTDHMEPTAKEQHQREAAQLLVYAYGKLNQPAPVALTKAASDLYGGQTDRWVERLCTLCREMTDEQMDRIVYNARDPQSRRLADWYEQHVKEDTAREKFEKVYDHARKNSGSYDAVLAYVKALMDINRAEIESEVANITGQYYDFEDSTHIFQFDDGIIILSAMDGLIAYKGKPDE